MEKKGSTYENIWAKLYISILKVSLNQIYPSFGKIFPELATQHVSLVLPYNLTLRWLQTNTPVLKSETKFGILLLNKLFVFPERRTRVSVKNTLCFPSLKLTILLIPDVCFSPPTSAKFPTPTGQPTIQFISDSNQN